MTTYTIISATGDALRIIDIPEHQSPETNAGVGESVLLGSPPFTPAYLMGGEWFPIPSMPTPFHVWDPVGKQWVDPGDTPEVLAARGEALRSQRDSLLAAADILLMRAVEDEQPIGPIREYRQALRNMGSQAHLKDPVWPTPP